MSVSYLVTMVLMVSADPVGVMMNQKSMLTRLTTRMAPYRFRPSRRNSFHKLAPDSLTYFADRINANANYRVHETISISRHVG